MGFLSNCNTIELKRAMCHSTSSIQRGRANENESLITVRAVRDTEAIVATAKTFVSLILKLKPTLLDDNALTKILFIHNAVTT